ncbi:MAG: SDR family oxidoreductase [Planctomycetes bacterium]|nr:SDR family oxidoreductase [Planctomycetota bacterium]
MSTQQRGAVVVTGASSGIGRACALYLDKSGYRVFATVRKQTDADALKASASPNLVPVLMDVTDEASIAAAAATVTAAVGTAGLAGLVNNAGYGVPGPIELIPPADLRRQFEVNVVGQVMVTQAFMPLIRQARGRIVNIGSVGGKITIPFGGALCASKYAIEAINDALRMELHPWGIHVVLIAPAGISTPAVDALVRDGEAAIQKFTPEGRRRYEKMFMTFLQRGAAREKKGSPPEVVARAVLKALTVRRPKTRYPVGADATPLTWLPWLLPARWLDQIRFNLFGLPPRFGGQTG